MRTPIMNTDWAVALMPLLPHTSCHSMTALLPNVDLSKIHPSSQPTSSPASSYMLQEDSLLSRTFQGIMAVRLMSGLWNVAL